MATVYRTSDGKSYIVNKEGIWISWLPVGCNVNFVVFSKTKKIAIVYDHGDRIIATVEGDNQKETRDFVFGDNRIYGNINILHGRGGGKFFFIINGVMVESFSCIENIA